MLVLLLVFSQLKSDRWQGTRLLWFLAIYGFGRAATDFLRGDTEGPLYLGLLSLTQLLSAASAVGRPAPARPAPARDELPGSAVLRELTACSDPVAVL